MSAPRLPRVDTMLRRLDTSAEHYALVKDNFDSARIAYEVEREMFASVRRVARTVLSSHDWFDWRQDHPNVKYTGLKLLDAIVEALIDRAYSAAIEHYQDKKPFNPSMTLEAIQEALERGGFEFRSATPLREVNGTLINPDKDVITRVAKGAFKFTDADEILKGLKPNQPIHPDEPPADVRDRDDLPTQGDVEEYVPGRDDVPF